MDERAGERAVLEGEVPVHGHLVRHIRPGCPTSGKLGFAAVPRGAGDRWPVSFNDQGRTNRLLVPPSELTIFPHIVVKDDDARASFQPRFPPPPEVEIGRLRQELTSKRPALLMGQDEVMRLSSQGTSNAAKGKLRNALRDFEAALKAAQQPVPEGVVREDDAGTVFHPNSSVVAWLHMQAHAVLMSGAIGTAEGDLKLDLEASLQKRGAEHACAVVNVLEPRLEAGTLLALTKEEQSFLALLILTRQDLWLGPTLLLVVANNQLIAQLQLLQGGTHGVGSTAQGAFTWRCYSAALRAVSAQRRAGALFLQEDGSQPICVAEGALAKFEQIRTAFLKQYGNLVTAGLSSSASLGSTETDALLLQFVMGGFAQMSMQQGGKDGGLKDEMDARLQKVKAEQNSYQERRGLQTCAGCGKGEPAARMFKKCGKCGGVWYCGSNCQRSHWKAHKVECSPLPPPGTRVCVTGVVSRPELNGREGVVSNEPAAAPLRAIVSLKAAEGSSTPCDTISLKAINLTLLD
ncbi:hypothetical protein CYMTET_36104 [Cymbomonas tetramitiformis]|uniref:MYND-type domain-containing protein n=1 Tax=Cymbomonas tetramitiformis TaxID=36881 RepID=A0AAE0CI11_9CHLO|nr:hypothetical protein CYMTET_36104 [Cymbomonas tetramitiformis]|eukprot:gene18191-21670_t